MSLTEMKQMFSKAYWPAIVVVLVLAGGTWAVIGAVGRFTSMVDQRAQARIEAFAAAPLAEHKEFERRISQNETEIRAMIEVTHRQERVLDRLVGIEDERQRRAGIPVRSTRIGQ